MIAEVISIGDELTSGQRLDTNSQWLSTQLGELGVRVLYHTTVADDFQANRRVIEEAIRRADAVVITGGLGPTADDLTRDVIAAATGRQLVLDEPSLEHIRALFARRKRDMPERNIVQAMFPQGSRPIHNPHGSAPGIAMEIPRDDGRTCRLFALPGVPAEMKEMWPQVVDALSDAVSGGKVIRHRRIKCFGIGESDLEQRLPDLIRRGRTPSVGITVSAATITLRITSVDATPEDCRQSMEPTIATIRQCLGSLIFGEEDDELQHAVLRALVEQDKTLAVAEWGTGGQISHWLREAPESARHFLGGVSLASAQAAGRLLGAPGELFDRHGSASAQAVEALATHCRDRFGSDYALAVGSFPELQDGAEEPGRVHFALATSDGVQTQSAAFTGHPAILKVRAAKQALNLVRLSLVKG